MRKLKNVFNLTEISGSIGDLGTMLPLSFALIAFNGYGSSRLFFLWGIVYLVTGIIFKVPVSVQPLKAMAVIAISNEIGSKTLAVTAFFYGVIVLILSSTGIIDNLQKFFSAALIKGIQFGIGLILAYKAIQLVIEKGFLLNLSFNYLSVNISITLIIMLAIAFFQFKKKFPLALLLVAISIPLVAFFINPPSTIQPQEIISFTKPDFALFANIVVLLIIPQLPLTLGNAMYAASDACHSFWPERSQKITPRNLGYSIGFSNIFIGLLGGFPVCHGAGGIAAHKQFGGQSGGATIFLGVLLILSAIIPAVSGFIFLIPVPLLAAMLLFDSWRMILMVRSLKSKYLEIAIALCVGLISFITLNLAIALLTGFSLEWLVRRFKIQGKLT